MLETGSSLWLDKIYIDKIEVIIIEITENFSDHLVTCANIKIFIFKSCKGNNENSDK